MWKPSSTLLSCAVIRSRLPSFRILPSRRYSTPSFLPISRISSFLPLKEKEEALKSKDPNKPVSIVFPYSYSMMEALLTYLSSAFFQDPLFQYEGFEDGDTKGAMLMEMVVRSHCINNKVIS